MYQRREPLTLKRACEATQIPSGFKLELPAGAVVIIQQTLGGNFTVLTDQGGLARIDEKDADALGEEFVAEAKKGSEARAAATPSSGVFDEKQVWEELKTVYDPEIPANIVDLGLVYLVASERLESGANRVIVHMTLTAPGCGIGPILVEDVRQKVS